MYKTNWVTEGDIHYPMKRFVSNILNIGENDLPRFFILYGMFFMIVLGTTWGLTVVRAAFLEQIGVEFWPLLYVINGLISVPAVIIYTGFADRVPNDRLMIAILTIGIVGYTCGLGLLISGMEWLAYPVIFLFFFVPMSDIFQAQWYTYVNSFYDTRSAKRIVPVLNTSAGVAVTIAGLTMPLLTSFFASHTPAYMIGLWILGLLTMAILVKLMPILLKEQQDEDTLSRALSAQKSRKTESLQLFINNAKEGYSYIRQSPYLLWLALSMFFLVILLRLVDYRTNFILVEELKTTKAIADLTGLVTGVASLISLPIQFFLLSRMIGWMGLGNALLIFPIGMVAISSGLIASPGITTAALGFFALNEFLFSFGFPISSLLYNAVPLRVKGRARAFINSLIFPVGGFIGGILLLTPISSGQWTTVLEGFIGVLSVGYLITNLFIRKQYRRAMVKLLEEEDLSSLMSQDAQTLSITDSATLQVLTQKLEQSTSPEFTVFMAKIISQVGGNEAVPILGQAANQATTPYVRFSILDILNAADVQGETIRQLYQNFLHDPDARVRQSALSGLSNVYHTNDTHYLSLLQGMLEDSDAGVRTQALLPLIHNQEPHSLERAQRVLNTMLASKIDHERALAVHVLGTLPHPTHAQQLATFLHDPSDEVRLNATLAFERMVKASPAAMTELVNEHIHSLAQDTIERVRITALTILRYVKIDEGFGILTHALTDPSLEVRSAAADTLVLIGAVQKKKPTQSQRTGQTTPLQHIDVVGLLEPYTRANDKQLRRMAICVLSRIDRETFQNDIHALINENLITIYETYGQIHALLPCQSYPGIRVLYSALCEENQRLIDEIFYLLSAIHEPNSVQIVQNSLQSQESHVRANAIEALESMTTSQIVRLMEPLFDTETTPEDMLRIGKATWEFDQPTPLKALEQLLAKRQSPWLRTMVIYALGDLATLTTPQQTPPTSSKPARGQRAGKLLDALFSDNTPKESDRPSDIPKESDSGGRRSGKFLDMFLTDKPEGPTVDDGNKPLIDKEAWKTGITRDWIAGMIQHVLNDPLDDIRIVAQATWQKLYHQSTPATPHLSHHGLSPIERVVFLKRVPFFQGMTIEQLKELSVLCEELFFPTNSIIFHFGDPGGELYVIIQGQVGIDQEKRGGQSLRLATIGTQSFFGEENFFDSSPHPTSAIALQDTLTLRLRREPVIALARQNSSLSLTLINLLSLRLRETLARVAELTKMRPRELQRLYDQFE